MIYYLPNILTVFRILLTPLFIYILFWGGANGYPWALTIFITAGITDIIDGYLARRLKVESSFGKMLDPAADKILILSAFVSFVTMDLIFLWMVILIILRDVLITAIRYLLEKQGMPMVTSSVAKAKTGIQVACVIVILCYLSLKSYQVYLITDLIDGMYLILILMLITVLFTLYTGFDYFFVNRSAIRALIKSNSQ
ncbi:MAG: CDP-diacylglycerol--glycerol-3-phosphate 3-phosphatidyltransferase [Fidelibacterota bacterium]|nr:MAG: CDP-diacylglycerol--glycerol-3-phosphate 3-phosphatidyltransferase [Candidatus Neomarinimicrobiota bacterium]